MEIRVLISKTSQTSSLMIRFLQSTLKVLILSSANKLGVNSEVCRRITTILSHAVNSDLFILSFVCNQFVTDKMSCTYIHFHHYFTYQHFQKPIKLSLVLKPCHAFSPSASLVRLHLPDFYRVFNHFICSNLP